MSPKETAKRILAAVERVLFGGDARERALVRLLAIHYRSRFRRAWRYRADPPHFFQKRIGWFLSGFDSESIGAYPFTAGFLNSALIQRGDSVLDIGCGDGFYPRQFYAERAAHVDAIDVDEEALREARKHHPAPNITYSRMNAVTDAFPRTQYDLVMWDGALGHFSPADAAIVMEKIAAVLGRDGIFSGSEVLGLEGHDHLQSFENLEEVGAFLRKYFAHVDVREEQYRLLTPGLVRREVYWRCSNVPLTVPDRWTSFDGRES